MALLPDMKHTIPQRGQQVRKQVVSLDCSIDLIQKDKGQLPLEVNGLYALKYGEQVIDCPKRCNMIFQKLGVFSYLSG